MSAKDNGNEKIVQDICGVSQERSKELLEAASGNVERAIEIHLFAASSSDPLQPPPPPQHSHSRESSSSSSIVVLDVKEYRNETNIENESSKRNGRQESKHEIVRRHATPSNEATAVVSKRQMKRQRQSPSPKKQAKLSNFFGDPSARKPKTVPSLALSTKPKNNFTTEREDLCSIQHKSSTTFPMIPENDNTSEKDDSLSLLAQAKSPSKVVTKKRNITSKNDTNVTQLPPSLHYLVLAEAFSDMAATTKRLAKIDSLKQVIKGVIETLGGIGSSNTEETTPQSSPSSALKAEILYQTLALILPNEKLQVSGSSVSKAVMAVTGASRTKLREAYRKSGDLGDAAGDFVRNQTLLVQPKPLTIPGVYNTLQTIASQTGKGSQTQRQALMVQLLRSCRQSEMRFLVRTLLSNMRLGASLKTVLVALAGAVQELDASEANRDGSIRDTAQIVQQTFDICPRLDRICSALLKGGVSYMQSTCVLEVGTPVNPMLANPASSLEDVAKLMTGTKKKSGDTDMSGDNDDEVDSSTPTMNLTAVAEWKYDGQRCQAHFDGVDIKLYSRHLLDNTEQFPDVAKSLLHARKSNVQSFIVDAEIVAVKRLENDSDNIRLLPFQDLATRSTSGDGGDNAVTKETQVEVRLYAFDLILINGTSLIEEPLWKRQQLLKQSFDETRSFAFATSLILQSYNEKTISDFLQDAVQGGAEGLMVKLSGEKVTSTISHKGELQTAEMNLPTCSYESGTRSQTWLKVKRDYVAGFADTIDVVPIGAWYGTGRKAQKGFLSPVLLAVYNEEEDTFYSVSRCMSFSDKMYTAMRNFYFDGTPYPSGVGMGDGILHRPDMEIKSDSDRECSHTDTDDDTESINDNNGSHDDEENRECINCFPCRPSSAMIVTNESPPIWFKPNEVFEVSFADLSLSRQHTAAAGIVDTDSSRGVALRFPRFCRRRPDQKIEQATTTTQIAHMFGKQAKQGRWTNKQTKF